MEHKMKEKDVLNIAHHILMKALRGDPDAKECITMVHPNFQVYSPHWIDDDTPQFMVVYSAAGPSIVINNPL